MIHLGVVTAVKPYRFVRPLMSATVFLACLSGEGRVFNDGEWAVCRAGSAVLLQPHTCVAYYAVGTAPWELVWVCYQRIDERPAVATVSSPGLADYDPQPIFHAVEGLRAECIGANDPICLRHSLDLIHRLVIRYAEPWRRNDRLHCVWEKVASEISADWTLDRIAQEAHCSAEHLRRLCQQQLGRSPMQHVAHLRLRRATELLLTTDSKIELIAAEVGYHDPFAFSSMFKKWIGCSPTEYRQRD
jgi:AraC-like DNA-binding protein